MVTSSRRRLDAARNDIRFGDRLPLGLEPAHIRWPCWT